MRFLPALIALLAVSLISIPTITFAAALLDQSADDYRVKGYDEQKKGNFPEALTYYLKALSLGLKNAAVYNDVGVVYEQMEMLDKAEDSYLTAVQIDPKYLPPYTNLAFLYKERGDKPRAIHYFEERLHRSQDDDPWRERAKQELCGLDPSLQQKILEEEAQALNEKLALKAREEFFLQIERAERHIQNGNQILAEKNFAEAIAEFDRALALTPGNPKALEARQKAVQAQDVAGLKARAMAAVEKLEAGQYQSSRAEFQKILAEIPEGSNQTAGNQ